jgi:hypothetical protein
MRCILVVLLLASLSLAATATAFAGEQELPKDDDLRIRIFSPADGQTVCEVRSTGCALL